MKKSICLYFICFALISNAQTLRDTARLQPFTVFGFRMATNEIGKTQQRFDSLQLSTNVGKSLAELLENESSVALKSYGINGSVSPALRGTAADHTAVMWNGINLQSATHGQFDLSLFPSFFVDEIHIEAGAGAGAYGSGAVGGALVLGTTNNYERGFFGKSFLSGGSFGKRQIGFAAGYSSKKFSSQTRFYQNKVENNYAVNKYFIPEYNNYYPLKTVHKLKNAVFSQRGFSQESSFRINRRQELSNSLFFMETDRPIINSSGQQYDNNLRNSTRWTIKNTRSDFAAVLGLQRDILNYKDTTAYIYGNSSTFTGSFQAGGNYFISNTQTIFLQGQLQHVEANVTGYGTGRPSQDRVNFWGGWQGKFLEQKLSIDLSARQQWIGKRLPFIPSVGLQYQILPSLTAKFHVAGVYHAPDFNDLYWSPGGNRNLKPEQGWSYEGGILKIWPQGKAELTAFSNRTKELIVWTPGPSFWSPSNVKEVLSQGIEFNIRQKILVGKHIFSVRGSYTGLNSKTTESNLKEDKNLNKQLIYIPQHRFSAGLNWGYSGWRADANFNYTSKRFIYSDNSSWLPEYYLFNFTASKNIKLRQNSLEVFAALNNALNHFYMPMLGYPMPGRNYELGIKIKIK